MYKELYFFFLSSSLFLFLLSIFFLNFRLWFDNESDALGLLDLSFLILFRP